MYRLDLKHRRGPAATRFTPKWVWADTTSADSKPICVDCRHCLIDEEGGTWCQRFVWSTTGQPLACHELRDEYGACGYGIGFEPRGAA